MRKFLLPILGLTLFASAGFAQVDVTATAGTANASYTTLQGAFDAINLGTHQGTITIGLSGSTTEAASAVLNASGTGSASYATIAISPTGGAARTISGTIAGHLIDLNGAKNVTIDGLNTGGNTLTIDNTSNTASTSTLRFRADTSSDIVTNCTIKGAGSSTTFGTVFFDTGTTTGNFSNTISNNSITNSGANFPNNAIYSAGTSAAIPNTGTISGNNIQDYFSAASATVGINVAATNGGNSAWMITNNKLFQTATRIYTTGNTHNGILVGTGSGYTITGNTIGFANSGGTGTTNIVGNTVAPTGTFPTAFTTTGTANATRYIAINCTFTAGGAVSNIQGNTVAGIALYTSSSAGTTNGILCGIQVLGGNANIGTTSGNTIGATSGGGGASASSLYAMTTTNGGAIVGIYAVSVNTVTIQNNTIGSIDAVGNTAAQSGAFTGIDDLGAAGVFNISNNTIGNPDADNIRTGFTQTGANLSNSGAFVSTTGSGAIIGIRTAPTGAATINNNNTLRGWANGTTTSAVTGITQTGASVGNVTINLNALGTAARGWIRYPFANSGALTGITNSGFMVAGTSLSIQSNDFRGIVHTTAGTSAHTYITNTAVNPNTTISSNTFTNLSCASTGSVTFISNSNHAAGTTHNINSNSVVTAYVSSSTGTVVFYLAIGSSTSTVTETNSGNNFSNMTFASGATISGWVSTDGTTPGPRKTITNNTFSAIINGGATATTILTASASDNTFNGSNVSGNIIGPVTGGGDITGIVSALGNQNISSNTVTSLSSSGASATVTGISLTGGTTQNVNGNTISTLSGSGATSPVINGIAVSGGITVSVFKNKICDLSESGAITTTAPAINGLLFSSVTANVTLSAYNNLIGDLRTPAASLAEAIRGISVTATGTTSNYNVYYNTVRLAASSSRAQFGTTGIFHAASTTSSTAMLNLRNNAIINNSTPNGIASTVAYRRSLGTAGNLANYDPRSNNNVFYAGTPGASNLIYADGTSTAQTIAQYRGGVFAAGTIAPSDSVSATENPTFLSVTCGNPSFLHPDPTVATALESGAANVAGITDDVDGNTRQGNPGYVGSGTAPDIGAVEFGGIASDTVPPTISYAALGSGVSTAARAFVNVVVTDASGVNGTLGTRPRVYYKKTTDANNTFNDNTSGTVGWKFAEANGSTSPFDFTIDYSRLFGGTASSGDTIQYFVVAQDNAGTPNVGINAGFFTVQPASVALTAAAFPVTGTNSYNIITATRYSGSYNVGPTDTITTLTGAGGFFSLINAGVVTGNITVNITGDIATETGANALNALNEEGGSGFTVTIQPSGAARNVSGSNTAALIKLNGASRVTINGSIGGAGTDRSLTITNTSAQLTPTVVLFGSIGTTPIVNDTLKNCVIVNGANTGSAVIVEDTGAVLAGYFNNITIQNNNVQKALRGVFVSAGVSGTNGSGTLITQNDMNTSGANSIRLNPISVQGTNGVTITNNNLGNISDANAETPVGILLAQGVDNATVTGNTISGITSTSTTGSGGATGILVSVGANSTSINVSTNTISSLSSSGTAGTLYAIGTFSPNLTISNNMISNLANTGATNHWGILLGGGTFPGSSNSTVSGNSISTMTSTASVGFGINIQGATTNVNVSGNTVSAISSSSGTTGLAGILLSGSEDNVTVQKNKVTGIFNSNTGTFGAKGIRVISGNRHTIVNNFVSDVKMDMTGGGAFSTTFGVHGIAIESGSGHKIDHNSVNLFGLLPGTATASILSSAFTINATTSVNCEVRNNIFSNTITGGTTSIAHVSTCLPASGTNAMNLLWNNNAMYTGTTAGVHGVCDVGATYISPPSGPTTYSGLYPAGSFVASSTAGVSNLRSYTSTLLLANNNNDNGSFASTTAAPFTTTTDLHLNTGLTPTPLESGGASAASTGVTTDIDGDTRPGPAGSVNGGATAPDIGADEFDGVPLFANDMSATAFITPTNGGGVVAGATFSPTASFTNTGAANQTNVTVRYRICTDGTCSTELYNNTQTIASITKGVTTPVTFASTSVAAGTYTIKARAELAGDQVPANDEISGTFAAESPLNGSYTVGSGGSYSSLTQAVNKLNSLGVSGPVIFNLTDAMYNRPDSSETYPITINAVTGASSTNTVTIKPASGNTVTMSASSASSMFKLNGASWIIIDGSNNGSTSRNLTITNTSTAGNTGAVWVASNGTGLGSTNCTIKNCNISTGVGTGVNYGIFVGGSTIVGAGSGADNDNITIQNNAITVATIGVYANGTASVSTGGDDNLAVTGNSVDYNGTLASIGIEVGNALTSSISQNTVSEQTTASQSPTGISLETGFVSSSVTRNTVSKALTTNTGGYGGRGITVGTGTATSALQISNNVIYGVNGSNWNSFSDSSAMGIAIGTIGNSSTITTTAGGINLYFNSVNMAGTYSSTFTSCITTALYIGSGASALDLRDNVFVNSLTQVGTGARAKAYSIYSAAANTAFTTIDYNDYFVSGAQGVLGFLGSDQATLGALQTAFGQNANSIAADPLFNSATDLHLQVSSPLIGMGVTGTGITVDIDGDTRPSPPTIGADEPIVYTLTYTAGANGSISGTSPQTVLSGGSGTAVTAVPNTGYHFVNWSDSSIANPRTDTNVLANVNVTANFAINTYTLTYTAGANGSISGTSPQTVNYGASGTAVTAVPDPGYHFVNWSDASTSNPRTDTNVMADISVTANFAVNISYTMSYDANGGTGTQTDPNSPYASGSTVTVLGTGSITRAGYTFSPWNTAADDSGTPYNPADTFTILANTTLFAQWTVNNYTVTYDGNTNDGGTAPAPQSGAYNTTITVAGPGTLSKTGFIFTGWNTAADGSGTEYAAGASFIIPANDTTLFAQWIFLHVVSRSYVFDGTNTTVTVTLSGPPNQTLNIEYATGLVPSSWTASLSNPVSTTGTGTFSIMITVAGDQRPPTGSLKNMFFRAAK